ncbi:MAG: lipase maturation factor family protein [Parachlamydiaceae bacterium]|nr:lipase maturation factor family protein [Parachlamydiaceae bacterium]
MWDPNQYHITIELLFRLLGVIYFFVFFPFTFQIKGLLGSGGILPIKGYLEAIKKHYGHNAKRLVPTLFWLNSNDKFMMISIWTGIIASILLALGIGTPLMILLLYVLHLSLVSAGQDFLSFGWELFLLEIASNSFFLSLTAQPNPFIWISLNLLLFRFHFQGGAVKLQSRDANWRNLTAIGFHYQSQPLPNTLAWYAHKLPISMHKFSTALMFFIELAVPFGIFGPEWMRMIVFALFAGLQLMIWATGNFSYLNHLTLALTTILLGNTILEHWFEIPTNAEPPYLLVDIIISCIGVFLITFQLLNLWENTTFWSNKLIRKVEKIIAPFHIINRYGIFAVMTTKRYEIVIEGSLDGVEWKEYIFKYKPSEINYRPRRNSPIQPRLDWQMWFLPFNTYYENIWFQNFLAHLLKGQKEVLALLNRAPFGDTPPKYIRALAYDYEFSDWEAKNQKGEWWKRKYVGLYSPTLTLKG